MRRAALGLAVFSAAIWGQAAGAARAAPLVLDCKVEANRPDHGLTHWRRQIIIDPVTRTVKISDDIGHGLTPRAQYPLASVTPQRFVLEDRAGKISQIDRTNGAYMLRDAPARFALRGRCVKQ